MNIPIFNFPVEIMAIYACHCEEPVGGRSHASGRSAEGGQSHIVDMQPKQYYFYIMTNKLDTVIYAEVAGDLAKRVYEHKNKLVKGFTSKYNKEILDNWIVENETQNYYSIVGGLL